MIPPKNFKFRQRVMATYHSARGIDPPMIAIVLLKARGKRAHLFAGKGGCDWYWILGKGNIIPSLYPETCLQDAIEYADNTEKFIKANEIRLGEKGYSYESYFALKRQINIARGQKQ